MYLSLWNKKILKIHTLTSQNNQTVNLPKNIWEVKETEKFPFFVPFVLGLFVSLFLIKIQVSFFLCFYSVVVILHFCVEFMQRTTLHPNKVQGQLVLNVKSNANIFSHHHYDSKGH